MASARYTLNIDPEELKPEEEVKLTPQEARKNWLHYHKWQIVIVSCLVVLAGWLIHDIIFHEEADQQIAIITAYTLPDETITALEEGLSPYFHDVNGDGKVILNICQYTKNYDDPEVMEQVDAQMQMAAELQITTDLSTSSSLIFITDSFDGLQDYAQLFAFLDDPYGYPQDSEKQEYDKMAFRWGDSALLAGLELPVVATNSETGEALDGQYFLADFSVAMRTLYDAQDEELVARFADCAEFMKLAQKTK